MRGHRAQPGNRDIIANLLRHLVAGLLRHQVLGIPVGPVGIPHAGQLLVLAVRGLRTPEGARQVDEANVAWSASTRPGESRGNLLQQPAVAVGILRRSESGPGIGGCPGLTTWKISLTSAPRPKSSARRLDVRHNKEQALCRAWRSRCYTLAEVDRGW